MKMGVQNFCRAVIPPLGGSLGGSGPASGGGGGGGNFSLTGLVGAVCCGPVEARPEDGRARQ